MGTLDYRRCIVSTAAHFFIEFPGTIFLKRKRIIIIMIMIIVIVQ